MLCGGVRGGLVLRGDVGQAASGDGGAVESADVNADVDVDVERVDVLVGELCARGPLVLAVEDLDDVDESVRLVWGGLSRLAPRLPLLLLATVRPAAPATAAGRFHQRMEAEGATALALGPLGPAETAAIAEARFGAPPGTALRRWLDLAAGNPAFVEAVIDALARGNEIDVEPGLAEATKTVASGYFPPALVDAVRARLGHVPADGLDVLRTAALLGGEFSGDALAAIGGRSPLELLPLFDELIAAGLLDERGTRLRFRHPLVREALYHGIRESRRFVLHRQAAQSLAEAGAPVEQIAGQLRHAAGLAQGWSAEWLAARADELTFRAPELALDLFKRAIDHYGPEDPARLLLEEKAAAAAYLLGRGDSAPAALDLLEHDADPGRVAGWAFMSAMALMRGGKYEDGTAVVAEAVARLQEAKDLSPAAAELWRVRFTGLHARLAWYRGQGDESRSLALAAVHEGERIGDPLAAFYGNHILCLLDAGAANPSGALSWVERGIAMLEQHGQLIDEMLLLMINRVALLERLDRTEEGLAVASRAADLAERHGITWRVAHAAVIHASLLVDSGRWDEALAVVGATIDRPETTDYHRASLAGIRALIMIHRGRPDDARPDMDRIARIAGPDSRYMYFAITAQYVLAESEGRLDDAIEHLRPALTGSEAWDVDERHLSLTELARLALDAGDTQTARAAAAEAELEARGGAGGPRHEASARCCRGLVDRDPEALETAIAYYRRTRKILFLAQTLEGLAVILAQRGDSEGARSHLEQAAEAYQALGAVWDLRRADERLREFGVRRGRWQGGRRRAESGWEALTPAEAKVAGLVAQGRSTSEIAAELFLSPRTVHTHVSRILGKLGLRSRGEVIREAALRESNGPAQESR
jgi:DNA-binding CsgD family transcriptional regulator